MAFDYNGAKQAGYSDQEIQSYLTSKGQGSSSGSKPLNMLDLLPTGGGIVGGVLGSPLGPVGTIGGGGVGSFLGEKLRQILSGEQPNDQKALTEGGIGLIGGGAGEVLSGGARLLGKLGSSALDKAGTSFIASQYNVPRQAARALNLGDTVASLSKYGINNINDIAPMAERVTGQNGLISQLTREAVAGAKPVETSGIMQMGRELLANEPAISPGAEGKVAQFFLKGLQKMHGGPGGSLSPGANPSEVFSFITDLEKKAAEVNRLPVFQRTPEQVAIKKVYQNMADELKTRLFQDSGGDQVVADSIASNPLHQETLAAIHPQLAADFSKVNTVADLRHLAEPFVKGSQLAAETQAGSQIGFNNVGGAVKGVGKLFQNPLNLIAAPLGSDTVNAGVGSAFRTAAASGGIPGSLLTAAGQTIGQGGAQATNSLINGGTDTSNAVDGEIVPPNTNFDTSTNSLPKPILDRNTALLLALRYPNKISEIQSLYRLGSPNVSSTQEKNLNTVANLKNDVSLLEQSYYKVGSTGRLGGTISKLTGSAGLNPNVTNYEAQKSALIPVIARAVGGDVGNLSETEQKRAEKLLPDITDTPREAQLKFMALKSLISSREKSIITTPTSNQALDSGSLGF